MDKNHILKKINQESKSRPLTVNLHDSYKEKYDRLSKERGVKAAEHLRQVIYPEIDRLYDAEFGSEDSEAS